MTTIENIRQKRESILSLARQYGVRNLRVFGSVARGEDTEKSDVDFLVDSIELQNGFERLNLMRDLETMLGKKVEVCVQENLHWYIKDKIIAEAKPV